MAGPRLRRLAADWEAIRSEFSGHPHVNVEPVGPRPPEVYRVRYRVPGLVLHGDIPVHHNDHMCEFRLPLGYPREQPYCVPLTPLFHPNVAEHYCIADYWFAGQSLVDVIAKVGEMIQYRIYNTKSPLNATAAYWAEQNPQLFPIGHVNLTQAEPEISLKPRLAAPNGALEITVKQGKE
jgi:ubiquitin-protein ligase